jgi:transcriptional regulator GlxA family with amidase domain
MTEIPQIQTRSVGLVIFPDFQILDAAGPIAALEVSARLAGAAPYPLAVCSRQGGAVRSSSGAVMMSDPFPTSPVDTLIWAGGQGALGAAACGETLAFARQAAGRARRIASVCSGAYILAAAGLLDGRRATTHWRRASDLQRRFPQVKVEGDRIYVRDGPVWTSAGITAGIDLALALIADDLGEGVAQRTAKELVVFHRRPGGQSQFSALLDLSPQTDRIARALAFARERLSEALPVERLAQAANLSPRQFARAFLAETGRTPAKAVEQLRVEAARIAVEDSAEALDQVASRTGFGDPERMRRAFMRAFGSPPQALRRAARAERR